MTNPERWQLLADVVSLMLGGTDTRPEVDSGVRYVHTRVEPGIGDTVNVVGVLPDGEEVARLTVRRDRFSARDRAAVECHVVEEYVIRSPTLPLVPPLTLVTD